MQAEFGRFFQFLSVIGNNFIPRPARGLGVKPAPREAAPQLSTVVISENSCDVRMPECWDRIEGNQRLDWCSIGPFPRHVLQRPFLVFVSRCPVRPVEHRSSQSRSYRGTLAFRLRGAPELLARSRPSSPTQWLSPGALFPLSTVLRLHFFFPATRE